MITYLIGTLADKTPTEITLDVGGIGYSVSVSSQTSEQLPIIGESVKLLTYLHFREEILQLYGFQSEEERQVFRLLISISGVGPKMAQTILSGMGVSDLRESIISNNLRSLTAISGVGKKTAERIVLELRDKITKLDLKSGYTATAVAQTGNQQARSDAYSALLSLGYSKPAAEKAMRAAIAQSPDAKTDELVRIALKQVQKA